MSEMLSIVAVATLLLAAGIWLMLPRAASGGRLFGTLLVIFGLLVLAWQAPRLATAEGAWVGDAVFYVLAAVTVLAAVCTVTFRNPGYSAIWFGLSLLGTAGLFLFQGAQFLGVATIVVYAGAILVTFLFVLMLAQPRGDAAYDRISWSGGLGALTGALLIGILVFTIFGVFQNPEAANRPHAPFPLADLEGEILANQHVAHLGAQLFSKYLVAVEVGGTLLLIALVGTVAIVERIRKRASGEGRPVDELALLENYLIVGAVLFGIGLVGFVCRRNMIVMFLSAEMMLQGVSVSLVAWGRYHNDWGGQMLVILILTVAACEAAIALAVVLTLFHHSGSLDIAVWQRLREDNQPAYVDREVSAAPEPEHPWPKLTPAGIEPDPDLDEITYRAHV